MSKDTRKNTSYLMGFVGSLLGSIIGSLPLAIFHFLGRTSSVLGFILGFLSVKWYRKFGGKEGKAKKPIVCICVFVGLVFGQSLSYIMSLVNMIATKSIDASYLDIPKMFMYLFTQPGFINSFVYDLVPGIMFAGIVIFALLEIIAKKDEPNLGK